MGFKKFVSHRIGRRMGAVAVVTLAATLAFAGSITNVARPGSATPVLAAPITGVAFTPSPTTALVGQTVSFNATASTPNAGASVTQFQFAFGDGSVVTVAATPSGATGTGSATHAYASANTYLASVTAMDSTAASGTASASVSVGSGQKLSVTATPNTQFAGVGQPVAFSINVSNPNAGATITNTSVNFGDGSASVTVPASQNFVSHTFMAPGTFPVTATATDSLGNTGTGTSSILVGGGNPPINNAYPNGYPYPNSYAAGNYVAPNTGYVAPGTVYNPVTNSYVPTTGAIPPAEGVTVSMAQGWSIVGGPSNTVIQGSDGPLYTYQGADSSYETVPPGSALIPGQGYWAYFGAPSTEVLPMAPGQASSLSIPAGHWVMVGNPGSGTATVSGVDYMVVFSTSAGQYQPTTSLQPGQGAWAWSWNGTTARIQST
jgi:PKD domain